jgi:hypothetical protein
MNERVSRAVVTFAQPFFVEGLGRDQPAGTYEVETVEEPIEGLSFLAYRAVSTSIVIPRPGGGRYGCQLARIAASVVQAARLETGKDTDRGADRETVPQSNQEKSEYGFRSD